MIYIIAKIENDQNKILIDKIYAARRYHYRVEQCQPLCTSKRTTKETTARIVKYPCEN